MNSHAEWGAVMFKRSEGLPELLGVMAKQLELPTQFRASCYVYVRDKKPNKEIPSAIKQYQTGLS